MKGAKVNSKTSDRIVRQLPGNGKGKYKRAAASK